MRRYDINIGPTYGTLPMAISGDYIRVLSAPSEFKISPDSTNESMIEAGLGWKTSKPFKSVVLSSATDQTISIMIGFGEIFDSRLAGKIDLNGALQMLQSGAITSTHGAVSITAAALLVPANVNRRSVLIQPLDGVVWYGNTASVTAANGIKIPSGGSMSIENIQDVYLIADGAAVDVRYLQEVN